MAERPEIRITKRQNTDEPAPEAVSPRKRAELQRFRLQVDRQTKSSYATSEGAEEAGLAIKQSHPIVQVAVYDCVEGINKMIDLPKS